MSWRNLASRLVKGSSSKRMRGLRIRERPSATRLLFAARERTGLALQPLGELQHLCRFLHPPVDLLARYLFLAQGIGEIFVHREMRIEREGLETPSTRHGLRSALSSRPCRKSQVDRYRSGQGRRSSEARWSFPLNSARRARRSALPRHRKKGCGAHARFHRISRSRQDAMRGCCFLSFPFPVAGH